MKEYDVNSAEAKYARKPIPAESRKGWLGVAAIYFGMVASLSAFAAGGSLVTSLTLTQSVIATLLTTLILIFVFYVPIGLIGAKEGLNTYIIGESAFGSIGSNIATAFIITIIPCVGWYGVQVSIAADALTEVFGGNTSLTPWIMIGLGIVFAIPAMYGVVGMAWLDYLAVPAILVISIYGFSKAISINGVEGLFDFQPGSSQSIAWGINLLIGSLVVGVSFTADYTRWTVNKKSNVVYSGLLGIFPALFGLTVIAAMMSLSAMTIGNIDEPWNVAQVLKVLGLPAISLILVIFMQWTTNITSAYSSGLALTKVFGWSRFWWTLIAALVGTLLSLVGIMHYFINFLGLLAAFVSPAAGIIISEYFFVSKRKLNPKKGIYWPGVISWLLGGVSALTIPIFIPALNGLLIGGTLYYLYHLVRAKENEVSESKGDLSVSDKSS